MSELGQLLKNARLEKGYSLEQLEEITKIRKRYLQAIENENFDVLPGNFYVRAFIKSYAMTVGINPEEVLKLYQSVLPSVEDEQQVETIRKNKSNPFQAERLGRWVSTSVTVLFVLFIFSTVYYFWYKNHNGDKGVIDSKQHITTDQTSTMSTSSKSTTASTTTQTTAPDQQTTPAALKPEVKLTSKNNNFEQYTVSNTEKLDVQLVVTGEKCWVQIDYIQNKKHITQLSKMIYKDEKYTWNTSDPIYMILGRPNAVKFIVNGNPITFDTANPKWLQFNVKK